MTKPDEKEKSRKPINTVPKITKETVLDKSATSISAIQVNQWLCLRYIVILNFRLEIYGLPGHDVKRWTNALGIRCAKMVTAFAHRNLKSSLAIIALEIKIKHTR